MIVARTVVLYDSGTDLCSVGPLFCRIVARTFVLKDVGMDPLYRRVYRLCACVRRRRVGDRWTVSVVSDCVTENEASLESSTSQLALVTTVGQL